MIPTPKRLESNCLFCENETEDNYLAGIWICNTCYPKFKTAFEHYVPFTDKEKLQELIRKKEQEFIY